jgi:glutathione S-transferase
MLHLVIANKLYSSWSLRPWLVLRAFDIPFTETVVPMKQADTKARIGAHSPTGKVPVLLDGDVRIWESLAIIEYLAESYPDRAIWPRDRKARAHARAVSNEMHAGFQTLRQACPMNLTRRFRSPAPTPELMDNVARIEDIWREARSSFGAGGPFLYGSFTAADAMYAPVVTRFDTYNIAVAPETRAYMDSVLAHPAFEAWKREAMAETWRIPEYEAGHTPL